MDLRQIANTFWGMAKVGDGILKSCRPSRDGDRAQQSNSGDSNSNSSSSSPEQAIRLLQQRAVELLQLLAPSQQQQQPGGGGGGGAQRLDIRDATQLWYGMAGLPYSWSDDLEEALEEATIQAMEAAVLTAAEGAADAAASHRDRDGGSRNGGGSGGHSSGWVESPTAVAQIVFRMAAVCGGRMGASHKARLAAVVDAMSYNGGDDDDDVAAASLPLDNPDCLLVGAQLLRLDLPPAAVRRLHDMALTLPPAVAARTGRTAMARALRSAVGLGLQPSAGEARRWESRLLGELGGQTWTGEELSWTMLALSYVKSYLPDAEAREELLGALRRLVRQLRANDATRVQQAMDVWGLRLPEREAALLRQKASGAGWSEPREERGGGGGGRGGGGGGGGRGGGGGGGGSAFRSWGFAR
ncbi:hypothetical protein PLESTM_000640400 [Pleodorina starrii]|nr:hypothetical protein PLESTM_000640400 [Pleodorina starrii]